MDPLGKSSGNPGRIQNVDPRILDSNTPTVEIIEPKVDLLFGFSQGSGPSPPSTQVVGP